MEKEKKQVKISLGGAVFIGIVFILLIVLIIYGWLYIIRENNSIEQGHSSKEGNEIIDSNSDEKTPEVKEEEIIEKEVELSIDNELVNKAYKKIFNARDFIYKYVDIKSENMPNDLKLRLAWSNMTEDQGVQLSEEYFSEKGQSHYFKVEDFSKSIKDILGKNVNLNNESFTSTEDRFSTGDGLPKFVYNSNVDRYETNFEFGGAKRGYVEQFVSSATMQGDKLSIYVKPIFMCLNFEKYDDEKYDGYANYSYETDKFTDKLIDGIYNNGSEYTTTPNINVDKTKLNTYKYTFIKDGDYYYFNSLEKSDNV